MNPEKKEFEVYESVLFASFLTMAAGGLDAYSYLLHHQVFSGLQTGNLILFGLHLGKGDWLGSFQYFLSLLAFIIATMIVRWAQHHNKAVDRQTAFGKRLILIAEITLIALAGIFTLLTESFWPTILLSMAAAAELQEFRKLKGGPFTPLMMTGNVRKISEGMYDWFTLKDRTARRHVFETIAIVGGFFFGAFLAGLAVRFFGNWSILVPILSLVLALLVDLGHRSN
ncbi:YoaK family protein [Eupransor demetentiae]|uniref:UPF0700 family (YoaK) n=1 Tax=Eupransor demetentiae TaxID=3109584 RepID=A0ABM9N6G0_9LACO|nr:UPF0700 family (YoaK) [Lactobacillaceae bacterium LMG 33000]